MIPALVISLLVTLPFLYVVVRRPVMRRLALRQAVRRPKEAVLVVLGALLGAAIITGSFVVADTMDGSIRQIAYSHLGPVDELVLTTERGDWMLLQGRLAPLSQSPDVDGVLPIATVPSAVTSEASGSPHSAPRSQLVSVDFAQARQFGRDPHATGISGATPSPGYAAITADLAKTLDVRPLGLIEVYAYGGMHRLIVDRILPRRGIAGFWLGGQPEANNVFVAPETFDDIAVIGRRAPGAPPAWAVAVSNRGGVESGAKLTSAVSPAIAAQAGPGTSVIEIKQGTLDTAEAVGKGFRDMFTGTGVFGVLAGLLLLVNLFVMLAAERKPELGMARAVGMKRTGMVAAFATEGWVYALTASLLGTTLGVGLGRVIVAASQRIFSTEHNRFDLFFTVRPGSIAVAFAIAYVVALVTVAATSVRIARLNIIRAIRDIAEPPRPRRRRWLVAGILAVVLGALWFLSSLPAQQPDGLLLAPLLVLAGLAPLLGRVFARRRVLTVLSALAVVWAAVIFALFGEAAEGAPITTYVLQGIALTGAAVLLVTAQQDRIGGTLRKLAFGRALSVRLGLAYPLARASRTGLTVAMYALVVFILTFIATISHLIDAQVATETRDVSGGYDVVVSSSPANPLRPSVLERVHGVRAVAPLATTTADFRPAGWKDATSWNLTSFDGSLITGGAPALEDRGGYPTDRAAWEAVLRDPKLVIVDSIFLEEGGGPPGFAVQVGMPVTVRDQLTGKSRELKVAAISTQDYIIGNGALYGAAGARSLFGSRLVPSRAYVALQPGVNADAFAERVQNTFLRNGTEAVGIAALMDEAFTQSRQIFLLFEGYLAIGLMVGIAGLAVVMVRAVRERRRQIGTLRAIGFPEGSVGRAFALEAGYIATEGTVLGVTLALVTLYNIVSYTDAFGEMAFSVPWLPLTGLLVGTIAASLLATIGPALSASRIRPAVALRMTD